MQNYIIIKIVGSGGLNINNILTLLGAWVLRGRIFQCNFAV